MGQLGPKRRNLRSGPRRRWPPLRAHNLKDNDGPLGELARSLGYESEAAFNRALRRIVGTTPGETRRQARAKTSGSLAPVAET